MNINPDLPRRKPRIVHMLLKQDGSDYRRVSWKHLRDLSNRLAPKGRRVVLEGADGDEVANLVTYWWHTEDEA